MHQMRYSWIDDYLMQKPGVEKLPPQWNWIRYAIGGKLSAGAVRGHHSGVLYEQTALEFHKTKRRCAG